MSGRKNKMDLNISGLSPLVLNYLSPTRSRNSPAKNQEIYNAANSEVENLITGYDRWKMAEKNGLTFLNAIHNLKEKSRTSSEPESFTELENYCKKLKVIESIFGNIISQVNSINGQLGASQELWRSLSSSSHDPTLGQLMEIRSYLNKLKLLYQSDLSIKKRVIENIAHADSSEQSHVFILSWYCQPDSNELSRLIMQLKISPGGYRWQI